MAGNRGGGGGGDVNRQVVVELVGKGADSMSILARATEELRVKFEQAVEGFAAGTVTGEKMIGVLNQIAAAETKIAQIAAAETDRMAREAAATEKFVEQANAALTKGDAEQARIDAAAQARVAARDAARQKDLDAIAAASERAAKAAQKAAAEMAAADDRMARANAQAAEKTAMGALEMQRAFEATLLPLEKLTDAAQRFRSDGIDRAAAEAEQARRAFEATVIPLDRLADAAQRFKSSQIDAALRADAQAMQLFTLRTEVAAQNLGGFATAAEAAANRSQRMGYAMLNFSYLAQDVQYGMGAIANNIGLVTMSLAGAIPALDKATASIGGPAGFGAILMGLGVAAEIAWNNAEKLGFTWENLDRVFGTGMPLRTASDMLDRLKTQLQDLTGKTWKTAIDTEDIRYLDEQIKNLTEERQAYDRLVTGRTKEQQERAKIVEEAVVESGAGDDSETGGKRIVDTLEKVLPLEQTPEARALRKQLAELKKEMKNDLQGGMFQELHMIQFKNLEADLSPLEQAELIARREKAEGMMSSAAMSRQGAAALDTAVRRNEAAFRAQGIDTELLRKGLRRADDPIRAKEQDDREKALAKEREAARKKAVKDAEDAAKQHDAENEAEINLGEASGQEMKRQRIGRQKEAREKKQAKDKAKADHDRQVKERIQQAGKVGHDMLGNAEAMIDQNRLAQATRDPSMIREAELRRRLESVIATSLSRAGKDPTLSHEIVAKAFEDATNSYASALAITGNSIQALMQINTAAMAKLQAHEAALFRQWMAINGIRSRKIGPGPIRTIQR